MPHGRVKAIRGTQGGGQNARRSPALLLIAKRAKGRMTREMSDLKAIRDARRKYLMACSAVDDLGCQKAIDIINGALQAQSGLLKTQSAALKAQTDALKAETAFLKRIHAYAKNPNFKSLFAMRHAFSRFVAKTVSDDPFLAAIFESEYGSIRAEWAAVFERADNGEALQIGPHMWPWQDTEAEKQKAN